MANIIHLMGTTCAGKTTVIDKMVALSPSVRAIQIGKLLRAKYGEGYFNGQSNPAHTASEAYEIYIESVQKAIDDGMEMILIDGQPRDLQQAKDMTKLWKGHNVQYFLLNAEHHIREERARTGRTPGPSLDLAVARLTNDYKDNFVVLAYLLERGYKVSVIDTGSEGFNSDYMAQNMVAMHTTKGSK